MSVSELQEQGYFTAILKLVALLPDGHNIKHQVWNHLL